MLPEYHIVDGVGVGLVYAAVPKVACTSVKEALAEAAQSHSGVRLRSGSRLSNETDDYFKFAFVRNPFDRLVSCYEDKVRGIDQNGGGYYFSSRYNNWFVWTIFGEKFHSAMTFDEFVSLVARIPDRLSDIHFRSQCSLLFSHRVMKPDYIGRFESIDKDWEYISTRFDLAPLRSRNVSRRSAWPEYYANQATISTVWSRYRKDIETFGYWDECRALLHPINAGW